MPSPEQLSDDLAELEDLTLEELLSPVSKDDPDDVLALFCECCCTSCNC